MASAAPITNLRPARRAPLDAIIEHAISAIDCLDGDCDLEDDDPAGDPLDERGEQEDWRPEGIVLLRPLYGDDQSLGPINERAVDRDWQRQARS